MTKTANMKNRYLALITLLTLVLGWGGYLAFQQWLPLSYPMLYPLIPLFFFCYGVIFISVYEMLPARRMEVMLVNKVAKLLLSLAFALVYAQFVGTHIRSFLLTFLGYYFVYLIFEGVFFLQYEMTLKKSKR